jgi:phenylpropionate dioxygenase-like ring-hydroxylating dioxygenase large terminal subunit
MRPDDTAGSYPIALQREIGKAGIARAKFSGMDLIVWRADDDLIRVWEDRCPHRSVRLSAGRNIDHGIQCAYHGWKWGRDGGNAGIPAERCTARKDIRVNVLPSAVAGGIVWIAAAGEVAPDRTFIPRSEAALFRPHYIKAPRERVSMALPADDCCHFRVTPCDDNLSLIVGYGVPAAHEGAAPLVRRVSLLLDRIRRALESEQTQ